MEDEIKEVDTAQAKEYIKNGAIVLDVRSLEEFKEGHIPSAFNIDIHSDSFNQEIESLDKTKIYIVCCASGARSFRACRMMKDAGFGDVFNLLGGMSRWKNDGGGIAAGE